MDFSATSVLQYVHPDVSIICVVPAYKEGDISPLLTSLKKCIPPKKKVHVLFSVNEPEKCPKEIQEKNRETIDSITFFSKSLKSQYLSLETLYFSNIPTKKFGVGYARKKGMDAATLFFETQNTDGIILCLDADCTVKENYFIAVEAFFEKTSFGAASIYFEHPFEEKKQPIVPYELFLRYLKNAISQVAPQFGFHTVGSSMACRASAYKKVGGMNTRKAGEDFYFLQKFMLLNTLGEITETTVFPSCRESDRVPFGTGRSMLKAKEKYENIVYSVECFEILEQLICASEKVIQGKTPSKEDTYEKLPPLLVPFLKKGCFHEYFFDAFENTSTISARKKRFKSKLSLFFFVRCLNFLATECKKSGEIFEESIKLLKKYFTFDDFLEREKKDAFELLTIYRTIDSKQKKYRRTKKEN